MLILIYCAQIHNSATYQDVVYALCGKYARLLCSVFVALYAFGTCVTFVIIIGDQWKKCESSHLHCVMSCKWRFMWHKFREKVLSCSQPNGLCFSHSVIQSVSFTECLQVMYHAPSHLHETEWFLAVCNYAWCVCVCDVCVYGCTYVSGLLQNAL